ncbi:RHD protein, partial [Thinocorus orbignyianus]|nr:RHD protein [Thinocorus orbignyianus]
MSSYYRNFRNSVPWLILALEVVFIVVFYFLFSDDGTAISFVSYPDFQDVNHMVIFGFGFFLTFLKRYGFSSTGFNFLIIVLGVQWSALMELLSGFFIELPEEDGLTKITKATVSVTPVVISAGAVLGKTNPVQLILMTVVEITFFHISKWINSIILQVPGSSNMVHVHLFGAYFGLAVSFFFSEPPPRSEKNASTSKSDLFSMLGTLFLWVFWPSFNSILSVGENWKVAYNTYIALAVSAVTAFTLSAMTTKDGKFRMAHIHSAVLAGGVTLGCTDRRIQYPWIAMILGLLASVINILGSYCLQGCFNPTLKIHDSAGVHFTFGFPAVLGALAQVILMALERETYLPSLGHFILFYINSLCVTISVAVITGLISGFILNLKLFKTAPVSKYFEDQFYWEFPHLAVGF